MRNGFEIIYRKIYPLEIKLRVEQIKAILRKKGQSRRHNPPRLQTILQSYSNQTEWYWHEKQTYG